MSDKSSSDNNYAAHAEKNEKHGGLDVGVGNENLAETGGRRGSVALNIVENPLKASAEAIGLFKFAAN